MAILINQDSKVIIQGITGSQGRLHAKYMLDYNVQLVGGISPGKGGQTVNDVTVYNTIAEALEHTDIDASMILVPPLAVKDSAIEAIENGIKTIVIITEHVPIHDSIYIKQLASEKNVQVIGPNTIGIISPGKAKVGIMPGFLYKEGNVGIISRSGTLTHETASTLSYQGIGQSTCVCIGGDHIPGMNFIDVLKHFEQDDETKVIVMIGEIGGNAEENLAKYVKENGCSKPIIAFIAGQTAPPEKKMGHAGAIISGEGGYAESKYQALNDSGIITAKTINEIIKNVNRLLRK